MNGEPTRPKATDERQARAHRHHENVNSPIILACDVDVAVLGGPHERIEKFPRAHPRLVLVAAEETTAARALGRSAHTHRAHVRGKGDLGEQEYHQDDESLDEDRGDDLGTSLGVRVRCLKSRPSHG